VNDLSMTELEYSSDDVEHGSDRPAHIHRQSPKMVITRTPLRISFAGGGTDLPDFYQLDDGAVLSTAVDKYVYVTVKRHSEIFNEPIRLNYSRTEQVNTIGGNRE
jgi:D-glycero-alpha-D-manno-heptose-7-phosphate kinase